MSTETEKDQKIKELEEQLESVNDKLKTYSNHPSKYKYYLANKEKAHAKAKECRAKTDPEKVKEWNRRAYLKRKEKLAEKSKIDSE